MQRVEASTEFGLPNSLVSGSALILLFFCDKLDNSFNINDVETLFNLFSLIKQQGFQFEWLSVTFVEDNKSFYIDYDEIFIENINNCSFLPIRMQ